MIAQPKNSNISTVPAIDCTNDAQMVREGLRVAPLEYNAEWHRKSLTDRAVLAAETKIKGLRVTSASKVLRTSPHRLTVHLKNLKKSPILKTTYSVLLYKDQLQEYMDTFFGKESDKIHIVYYNGRNITRNFVD